MTGAWYKSPEWKAGLQAFSDWYEQATLFVDTEGDYDVDESFGTQTYAVIDFLIDVAELNSSSVFDVLCHIDSHRRVSLGSEPAWPTVTFDTVADELRRVQLLLRNTWRAGTTDVKPDRNAVAIVERQPRYKPPKCQCGGQFKVKSARPDKRYLECPLCGETSTASR